MTDERSGRKTIRVDVTAEDIAAGDRSAVDGCPVALAMTRAMGMPVGAARGLYNGRWVGMGVLPYRIGSDYPKFRLSRAVGDFILRFDSGRAVEPFSFLVVR